MKRKLLFLIHALNSGGAQRVLLELVNNIDFNRFDVTVQTIYDRGELKKQLNPQIRYKTIIRTNNKYIQMFESFFIRRIASPIWSYNKFIEDNYDYAVAFLEGECTRLIDGCQNKNTKKIAWVHIDFRTHFSANNVYKSTSEHLKAYQRFHKIVCVSKDVAVGFSERFQFDFGGKLTVKYNVIDGERIIKSSCENTDNKLPCASFNIISVGNMRKQKAYDRLLHVCKKLADDNCNFHLTIIGNGSEFETIKKLHEELNLNRYVTLLGDISNPYPYMKQADMLLLASYAEGFSTVLIESIILELPAMVTECAGMREILNDGEFGIIIPNNENSIYENLKSIIDDSSLLDSYKQKLPQRKNFFDKNNSLEEIMALFNE